jgi:hypothetical protein
MKSYLTAYSVGDACIMIQDGPCTFTLNGTYKHGSKETNIIYWSCYNTLIAEDMNFLHFEEAEESSIMLQLQKNYYEPVAEHLGNSIC